MIRILDKEQYSDAVWLAVADMTNEPSYHKVTHHLWDSAEAHDKVNSSIEAMKNNPNLFIYGAYGEFCGAETLLGMHIGYVSAPWYSTDLTGVSEVLFTMPGAHPMDFTLLVRAWERECIARGATSLRLGKSSSQDFYRFRCMAYRRGYTQRAESYTKILQE